MAVSLACCLTAAAGALDVLCLAKLGQAFASVVTGNLAVVGLGIGALDAGRAFHAATAVLGYGAGVLVGSVLTRPIAGGGVSKRAWISIVCGGEFAVLAPLIGIWIATGGPPTGAAQYVSLAAAATAMGLQTAAFRLVRLNDVITTYFTGTFTSVITDLIQRHTIDRAAILSLIALITGATASGFLVVRATRYAILLPALMIVSALVLVLIARRRTAPSTSRELNVPSR